MGNLQRLVQFPFRSGPTTGRSIAASKCNLRSEAFDLDRCCTLFALLGGPVRLRRRRWRRRTRPPDAERNSFSAFSESACRAFSASASGSALTCSGVDLLP